jgi:hypothetical protein
MHSKVASDWELFVTLRKQKNKEMKRLKQGSVLTGCRRDCLTVEEGAWIRQPGGQQSSCATRDQIHARK